MLASLLGRQTNFDNPCNQDVSDNEMDSIYKASKYKNRPRENYHDEGFMDKLIEKITKREEARKRLRDSTAFETNDSPTKS